MGAPQLAEHQDLERRKDLLRSCVLFQEADAAVLDFVAAHCESAHFKKGQCIILENEANDSVFFIARGAVEIVSYLSAENRIQRLALLKAGSHFAEFSVLTRSARSGSAYAFEDCELLRMPGVHFLAMLNQFPAVRLGLLHRLAALNQQVEGQRDVIPYYQDGEIHASPQLLQILPVQQWQKLGAIPVSLRAGLLTVVVKDPRNQKLLTYLSSSFPSLEVSVHIVGEQRFEVLHTSASRAAAIANVVPLRRTDEPVYESINACLKASALFGGFTDKSLEQLLPHLKQADFKAGDLLLEAGQVLPAYYLIAKGSVLLSRPMSGTTASAPVQTLRAGDGIGEAMMIVEAKSACSLRALDDVSVVVVPKEVILHLLSHAPSVLSLALILMRRLQRLGHTPVYKHYDSSDAPDFALLSHLLPPNVVSEETVLPLALRDGEVTLGTVSVDSSSAMVKAGRYLLDHRVRFAGISEEQFKAWQPKYLAAYQAGHAALRSKATLADGSFDVPRWINEILVRGFQSRASDIHFEPGFDGMTTRFRIDGVLREQGERLSKEAMSGVVNRLKVLSHMDIAVQHLPQDGHLEIEIGTSVYMARVSTLPVKHGEKMVLRLIRSRGSVIPLDMIAPDLRTINVLQSVAAAHQGLFLVTGPTGSGKTTTLYSLLRTINQVGVNVISLEDPIEMEISGVNQVAIQTKRGLDFGAALRSVLRQDPDVVMVGEIRDEESAGIVFEAAITGHLVLSTLHSGSSLDVVPRLQELGVARTTMAEGLLGVLTQRLVRAICKACSTERPIHDWERQLIVETLKLDAVPKYLKHGTGCASCGHTGYHDRLPVFEIWRNNLAMRDGLRAGVSTHELQQIARKDGFQTIFEFGLRMVLSGLTTAEEVKRVLTADS